MNQEQPLMTASCGNDKLVDLFWEGYELVDLKSCDSKRVTILLSPMNAPRCGKCLELCHSIHEHTTRTVRDCDLLDRKLTLSLSYRRVNCSRCGQTGQHVPWLNKSARMSKRLISWIEGLCKVLPIKHVAEHIGLSWHTVRRVERAQLERDLPAVDFSNITRLVMDEFALHKGHRYATVIADAETRQVLWVSAGRTRQSIRPFFKELGENCSRIKAVAMDQNSAFDLEVKAHCPNAEVVYDLFHVVAKYGREVIDRVRVDQANLLRDNKSARASIKRSRWVLLKNRDNLTDSQEVKLSQIMETNQPLATVYILKEQLKEIWRAQTPWEAARLWRTWWKMAKESGIDPLLKFARKLKPYLRGILASSKYPLNTSVLEGMNNKIKVIKRMAYGYRDTEHFFLKIKHAFPGK